MLITRFDRKIGRSGGKLQENSGRNSPRWKKITIKTILTMSISPAQQNWEWVEIDSRLRLCSSFLQEKVYDNDRSRFTDFVPINTTVKVGDTTTKILGIQPTLPIDKRVWPRITLLETLYSPGFHTNLGSMQRLEKAGLFLNPREGILETGHETPLRNR